MNEMTSVQVIVHGRVHDVFYRAFTTQRARELGLTGYVRNLPDKTVQFRAEGERIRLEVLIDYPKMGPPGASVKKVVTNWTDYTDNYSSFNMRY